MSANRDDIVKFCREYLKVNDFQDYCHNGLQVEGQAQVSKIVTGVSLSQKLIKSAIGKKAQMIIAHHGIFGDQIDKPPVIKGYIKNRIKSLLQHDISLCGFHLPLDAHLQIGNNISLCKLMGLKDIRPCDIGFIGTLAKPMQFGKFAGLVGQRLKANVYTIAAGADKVRDVGIISGGSSPRISSMADAGADTFIAGDIRESLVRAIEEMGMNFINAGHYNTEKLGIQNLGKLVQKKFKVQVEFVDVPCEI